MATANKGYTDQATGANSGTWGVVLNDEALDYIDLNLGGIVSKALTNSNVTLSASESRNAIVNLSGTLTGNVIITTACIGFFFVENLTTGAFTVTVRNASVATAATILQGTRQVVISDATNGCRLGVASEFASGTVMPFRQSAAPTGWTKETSLYNNSAFRCVTGSVSSGGTADFATVFAARTIAQANLPDVSLTAAAAGDHNHGGTRNSTGANVAEDSTCPLAYGVGSGGTGTWAFDPGFAQITHGGSDHSATSSNTSNDVFGPVYIPASGTHTHSVSLGGSGTAMDFAVKYVDMIIATKS
jgi:hypothetical protein